jgi:hypothetical protein
VALDTEPFPVVPAAQPPLVTPAMISTWRVRASLIWLTVVVGVIPIHTPVARDLGISPFLVAITILACATMALLTYLTRLEFIGEKIERPFRKKVASLKDRRVEVVRYEDSDMKCFITVRHNGEMLRITLQRRPDKPLPHPGCRVVILGARFDKNLRLTATTAAVCRQQIRRI